MSYIVKLIDFNTANTVRLNKTKDAATYQRIIDPFTKEATVYINQRTAAVYASLLTKLNERVYCEPVTLKMKAGGNIVTIMPQPTDAVPENTERYHVTIITKKRCNISFCFETIMELASFFADYNGDIVKNNDIQYRRLRTAYKYSSELTAHSIESASHDEIKQANDLLARFRRKYDALVIHDSSFDEWLEKQQMTRSERKTMTFALSVERYVTDYFNLHHTFPIL